MGFGLLLGGTSPAGTIRVLVLLRYYWSVWLRQRYSMSMRSFAYSIGIALFRQTYTS
jgi:hypothetical protein